MKTITCAALFLLLAVATATITFRASGFYCPNVTEIQATLNSPGELRVIDSYSRITGSVSGKALTEIPISYYTDETVILSFPIDTYRYQIFGTDQGLYGLEITAKTKTGDITFKATEIPIELGATHEYTIDWAALSEGKAGVTVYVDSDGDKNFEKTVTATLALSKDQLTQTTRKADINADGKVNIQDVAAVALAYGATATQPEWNEKADIDSNGTINIIDITLVTKDFGLTA